MPSPLPGAAGAAHPRSVPLLDGDADGAAAAGALSRLLRRPQDEGDLRATLVAPGRPGRRRRRGQESGEGAARGRFSRRRAVRRAARGTRHREFAAAPERPPRTRAAATPPSRRRCGTCCAATWRGAAGGRRRTLLGAVRAIAAPHVSPVGGSASYARAYGALPRDPAARDQMFVILGTSHYGEPDRFGLTRKPFATPFGEGADRGGAGRRARAAGAGDGVTVEDYCHAVEHSIEFQVVFLQYLYGPRVRILPILCGAFGDGAARRRRRPRPTTGRALCRRARRAGGARRAPAVCSCWASTWRTSGGATATRCARARARGPLAAVAERDRRAHRAHRRRRRRRFLGAGDENAATTISNGAARRRSTRSCAPFPRRAGDAALRPVEHRRGQRRQLRRDGLSRNGKSLTDRGRGCLIAMGGGPAGRGAPVRLKMKLAPHRTPFALLSAVWSAASLASCTPPMRGGSGGTGSPCGAGQMQCGTAWSLDERQPDCGTCGEVCGSGSTCTSGVCVCTGGFVSCGGTCVQSTPDTAAPLAWRARAARSATARGPARRAARRGRNARTAPAAGRRTGPTGERAARLRLRLFLRERDLQLLCRRPAALQRQLHDRPPRRQLRHLRSRLCQRPDLHRRNLRERQHRHRRFGRLGHRRRWGGHGWRRRAGGSRADRRRPRTERTSRSRRIARCQAASIRRPTTTTTSWRPTRKWKADLVVSDAGAGGFQRVQRTSTGQFPDGATSRPPIRPSPRGSVTG